MSSSLLHVLDASGTAHWSGTSPIRRPLGIRWRRTLRTVSVRDVRWLGRFHRRVHSCDAV